MTALALGTVQLGVSYGVSNRIGRPSIEEIHAILNSAWHQGIRVLDTASSYGNAEQLIGEYINPSMFEIISKISSSISFQDVKKVFEKTLHSLRRDYLYGLL